MVKITIMEDSKDEHNEVSNEQKALSNNDLFDSA